jgi:hypothetical protein
MGYRYEQPADRESSISFRVVEIFVANGSRERTGRNSRFLLVDNGHETLETVQREMHCFVRTAILANNLVETEQRKEPAPKGPASLISPVRYR